MSQILLVVAVALTVGAIVFGITVLVTGDDDGLRPVEPDGQAVPLPGERPLAESDVAQLRFDTVLRGYRMAQVDAALRRAAYDIGYKDELIRVLQAEVDALREGRFPDAEVLRRAREAALAAVEVPAPAVDAPAAPPPEPPPADEATPPGPAEAAAEPSEAEPAAVPSAELPSAELPSAEPAPDPPVADPDQPPRPAEPTAAPDPDGETAGSDETTLQSHR